MTPRARQRHQEYHVGSRKPVEYVRINNNVGLSLGYRASTSSTNGTRGPGSESTRERIGQGSIVVILVLAGHCTSQPSCPKRGQLLTDVLYFFNAHSAVVCINLMAINPTTLKRLATLLCDLSLITIFISGCCQSSAINISQGSVATRARLFNDNFTVNLLMSRKVKILKIGQDLVKSRVGLRIWRLCF